MTANQGTGGIPAAEAAIASATKVNSIKRIFARNQWLIADQALVSGANFITAAGLARALGVHEYGVFSILYAILLYLNSIQLALVVSPMMSLGPQVVGATERRRFDRGFTGYQILFSGCCSGLVILTGVSQRYFLPLTAQQAYWFPFALTVACFQCQDWFRRLCYLYDFGKEVFVNDIISYAGQLIFLLAIWKLHEVNVGNAYYVIALTSLLAFVAGALSERTGTSIAETRNVIKSTWMFGRSMLVASQFQWLGSQGILLVVAAEVSVSATSGIRAAATLLGPVNVLYQLIDNLIPVRASKALVARGRKGLLAYLRRATIVLSIIVGLPILCVIVFARPIMVLAFGKPFAIFSSLVVFQGIYTLLALLYKLLTYYHRTVGNANVIAKSALMVSVVSVGAAVLLARHTGATGAMIALDIGQIMNVTILLAALRYDLSQHPSEGVSP